MQDVLTGNPEENAVNIVDPNMSHGNGQLVSYADSGQSSYQIGAGGNQF